MSHIIDYGVLVTTVNALIKDLGRPVTVTRLDATPDDVGDPGGGKAAPRDTPAEEALVDAIFVHPDSAAELGMTKMSDDLMKKTKDIAIVAPGPTGTFSLDDADELLDEGVTKKVSFVRKLRPGSVTLLYFIGLRR